ncbi:16S rRNA (guanine(527)-N(7))-methyltransferase RsmG [Legionella dresdenensis]|uniref:Ribosomal RNA small subunit methyltransferase G n=1 Tax=Legionella dresdenensis TaxID=450200 RepID=A0ABV8CHL9_9GAMM
MSTSVLEQGLERLGLSVEPAQLMAYLALLQKWNKAYNLTAIRDPDDMVTLHLLDSLAITTWITGKSLLDVGAGAGLPGIPLAIWNPDLQVTLLDSNGKKTRFMHEVKRVLKLDNVTIAESRVENYQTPSAFDMISSRAFTELGRMIGLSRHLIANNGVWLAMKGRYPEQELQALDLPYTVECYQVPGLEGERCCVLIKNNNEE